MKTMADHATTCAHYGDSMMPCTCGAEPDVVGCVDGFASAVPVRATKEPIAPARFYEWPAAPRVITRVLSDGISTKDGCA